MSNKKKNNNIHELGFAGISYFFFQTDTKTESDTSSKHSTAFSHMFEVTL